MLDTIIKGGSMMIPLMILSVAAVAVVLDRGYAFYHYGRIDTRSLRAQMLELITQGSYREAEILCESTQGPVAAVLLSGVRALQALPKSLRTGETIRSMVGHAMEDHAHQAMSAVVKRFGVLSTVGSAAPLFGMIGTVTGMITSFEAMSNAKGGVDAARVAAGISEALITTAAGLLIAMIAVIPYSYFVSKSDGVELEVSEASNEMLDRMIARAHAREARAHEA